MTFSVLSKGSKVKSSQGMCKSALHYKQDRKAMWAAEERPHGPLQPQSSIPWEQIVKQEGSLPRIYTGEI